MPRRGGGTQQSRQGNGQAGTAWQQVHRFALVQELMRKGCVRESEALDSFEQLTGSRSGKAQAQINPEVLHGPLCHRTHPAACCPFRIPACCCQITVLAPHRRTLRHTVYSHSKLLVQ